MTQRQHPRIVGQFGRNRRAQNFWAGNHGTIQKLGIGVNEPDTALDIDGSVTLSPVTDPADPDEGKVVIWLADGTLPPHNRGDLVAKVKIDGQVKDYIIGDYSSASSTVLITDENGAYIVCSPIDPSDASAFIKADYEGE